MKNASQYSLCVSDLIMGLLFIFILILMKFMLEYKNKKTSLLKPREERNKLLDELENKINKEKIQVEIDKENGVLKLPNVNYFSKGSYILNDEGEKKFEKIKEIFKQVIICYSDLKNPKTQKKWEQTYGKNDFRESVEGCNEKYKNRYGSIDSILIEGHADATPIGSKLKSKGIETNMDLAMKRSQTVFSFLTDYTEATKKSEEDGNYLYFLSNRRGNPLFGVTSFGNLRRQNDRTPSSQKKDRRIDIRFITSQPKSLKKELKAIK